MIKKFAALIFFFAVLTQIGFAQHKWSVAGTLIGRRNFSLANNGQQGLGDNFKYSAKVNAYGELLLSYMLKDKISLQAGIGAGMSNSGISLSINDNNAKYTALAQIKMFYFKLPIRIQYSITNKLRLSGGLSFTYYADFERQYEDNFVFNNPLASLYYNFDSPFIDDFFNVSCDALIQYNFTKRFGAVGIVGIDCFKKYPYGTINVITDDGVDKHTYSYSGTPRMFYMGIGLTYQIFSFK